MKEPSDFSSTASRTSAPDQFGGEVHVPEAKPELEPDDPVVERREHAAPETFGPVQTDRPTRGRRHRRRARRRGAAGRVRDRWGGRRRCRGRRRRSRRRIPNGSSRRGPGSPRGARRECGRSAAANSWVSCLGAVARSVVDEHELEAGHGAVLTSRSPPSTRGVDQCRERRFFVPHRNDETQGFVRARAHDLSLREKFHGT